MALFGTPALGSTDGRKHYIEMKAGKMYRRGTWVYPVARKGLIYLYQSAEALMHFCWKDRVTEAVVDDLIVFPGDCSYSRVNECTTGRVYLLKFHSTPTRMFYWLQEPKTDRDEDHCKRINRLLNHPPSPNNDTLIPQMLNDMSEYELSQIFGPSLAATISSLMNQDAPPNSMEELTEASNSKNLHSEEPVSKRNFKNESSTLEGRKSNLKSPLESYSSDATNKKREKSVRILENADIVERNKDDISVEIDKDHKEQSVSYDGDDEEDEDKSTDQKDDYHE